MLDYSTVLAAVLCSLIATAGLAAERVTVGDDRIGVTLEIQSGRLVESAYSVNRVSLEGTTGAAAFTAGSMKTDDATLVTHSARQAVFGGDGWKLTYQVSGPGRITKTLVLSPKQDLALDEVCLWSARSPQPPQVARTGLQDIAAFYRQGTIGIFTSLDFPYSKIVTDSGVTRVTYPPHIKLKAGETYTCHSLTFGATTLTGRARYGFDDGEVDAMDAYVQERFKPRFERPMFVSCSINNRYTQLDGKTIFYTMYDHPTLGLNLDLLKHELALMPELGMEYYQVFPGVFDWAPDDPRPEDVRDIVRFANRRGVRIGDYSGASVLFCGHYNEYGNSLDKPAWRIQTQDGQRAGVFCFGCKDFTDYYAGVVAPNCRKYGFEIHCLDFLSINPCFDESHGHPVGADSIYQQVLGLTNVLQAINDISPQMMTWSNSGNWEAFLPKLAWYNPNLYITDPYIDKPWQDLNATRTMDDVRREQMVRLHYTHFLPYRFFTNCQYFFCQDSITPDVRSYETGALASLAVTPNLCLGEVRPWMDDLTSPQQARVKAFYTRWTKFLRDNFELWKHTYSAGDNPGPGGVEIYGHAEGSHGFVFLVNPNYFGRTVEVPLDASLGFSGRAKCEIAELYPVARLRLTPEGPLTSLGKKLVVHVPAQQVVVLEVRPAPEKMDRPRLYGVPGTVEQSKQGWLVKTTGPQGATERFAVVLPEGSQGVLSASVRADVPKQPKRTWAATPLKMLGSDGQVSTFEITFRREAAPTELREWRVKPGDAGRAPELATGFTDGELLTFPLWSDAKGIEPPVWDGAADKLGLGPLADLCGGYIDNAFSEQQETWIDITTGAGAPPAQYVGDVVNPTSHELTELAKSGEKGWWLQTKFSLPFMYGLGMTPPFEEHTILALPFIRRGQVTAVSAWINGKPLDVRDYRYPRNRGFGCYWADLVGSAAHHGENTLVVHYEVK